MIKIAAWCQDLNDSTLRFLSQIGVECADAVPLPTDDRGVFDLDRGDRGQKESRVVGHGREPHQPARTLGILHEQ